MLMDPHLSLQHAAYNPYPIYGMWGAVWPDLAIFWTLGNFLKHLATINLPQFSPFLGNYCKGVKIIHSSSETIFGQLL